MSRVTTHDLTIASGASTSSSVEIDDRLPVGLQMPSALTGTSYSVQVSYDGTTFATLYASGSAVSITHTNSAIERLVPADFAMAKHIRFVSDGTEGAGRTLTLWVRSEEDD